VALNVHLGLLTVGRSGQGHDSEDAWAHPFRDGLDGSAFACGVAALKQDDDLQPLRLNPFLQLAEFLLELAQFLQVLLALELGFAVTVLLFFLCHDFLLLCEPRRVQNFLLYPPSGAPITNQCRLTGSPTARQRSAVRPDRLRPEPMALYPIQRCRAVSPG